jgi:MATE family multidrug resistance protein
LRPLLKLAGPVVLAELGWMAMGVTDTIMVGRLGAEAIGAVAIGNIIFNTIGIMSWAVLLGMDTLVSQAFGRGDLEDCHHSLRQGLWLGAIAAPLLLGAMWLAAPTLSWWGVHPDVVRLAVPFTSVLALSVLPLAAYSAFRRYLQSLDIVRPIMFTLVTANLVNWAGNWVLIYGNLGAPAMGVTGSAWATGIARLYMMTALAVIAARHHSVLRWEGPDWRRIGELFRLGLPAAGHILLEIGVFAAVTALAGRFPPVVLAAHEVALSNASMTFMVPMGISSAAAVRVGQAIGRGDPYGARAAGWTAILVSGVFMTLMAIMMFWLPRRILAVYTVDRAVIDAGVPLLFAAATFQLFDGTQVSSIGALRGLGDTRTPFQANMFGYWVVALPVGMWLCFGAGWGVLGLWSGLILGLVIVACLLVARWHRETLRLIQAPLTNRTE